MATCDDALIEYDAPEEIRDALDRIGRTEDVQFSPDGGRLALVAYNRGSIAIVDVDIAVGDGHPQVTVTAVTELSSPGLQHPHGVVFLDNQTIAVGNRGGGVTAFRLPSVGSTATHAEMTPLEPPPDRTFELLHAPGSLAIADDNDGRIDMLVCNNYANMITRHTLQVDPFAVTRNDVLLRRWLDLPDGVAATVDGRWMAISNHNSHSVLMYERSSALHEDSDPNCILRGVAYPHGLRFTDDGQYLFAADAGKPFVQVFASDNGTWRGVQYPSTSIRVMDEGAFRRQPGRSKGEGGPKGIDIEPSGRVLAMTSADQRLVFFDVAAILERTKSTASDHGQQVRHELEFQEHFREAEAYIASLERSNSFRLTKPLRELKARFKKQDQRHDP